MKKCDRSNLPAWLQDVPEEWPVPLLRLVARVESGHTPSRGTPEYWVPEECTIPWFSLADIWQLRDGRQKYLGETRELISPAGVANSAARVLPPSTVILSRTASVGFSGIMPKPMATTQDFANFVCGDKLVPDYLLWVLRGMKTEFQRLSMGSTHMTIYMPDLLQFRIPLPPLDTQRAIADALDRKTAALDALIEKKERLVALLGEKRAALIHRAVTKGLDPDVPKKDSGIPWIGEIPAHWKVLRLKYVSPEITVGIVVTPAKYYVDNGVPCPRSLNVREMELIEDDLVFISNASNRLLSKSMIFEGDLLCVRSGQPGTTAVVDRRFDGANCIDLIIVRRSARIESRFLGYTMNSDSVRAQYTQGATGAIQTHFNVGVARDLQICVPPMPEQAMIVSYLDGALGQLQRAVEAVSQQVCRLREYRQALIIATVTGQLDIGGSSP